ncbi:MAG: HEAT repeat domain-containing protein [Chloroflexi bacterium]|nr:HEAT repeat domain-containing protein [Chloroflexota bacterium]
MTTIRYQVINMACGNCTSKLTNGQRRFGPAQVRCGNCGALNETGLRPWNKLSAGQKTMQAIGEVVWPSWLAVRGFDGVVVGLVTQFTLWFFAMLPLMMVGMIVLGESSSRISNLMPVGLMIYPGLLVWRLAKLVRESDDCTATGEPPTWGKAGKAASPEMVERQYARVRKVLKAYASSTSAFAMIRKSESLRKLMQEPGTLTSLLQALGDGDADVRRTAAVALGQMKAGAAVQPLQALLEDESDDVRVAATSALHALGYEAG